MHKTHRMRICMPAFCLLFCLMGCTRDVEIARADSYVQFYFTSGSPTFTQPGEQVMIGYFLDPADAEIRWSSDNSKVASVDARGVVTAVGPGRCNITAAVGAVTESSQIWDCYTTSALEVICDFD